MTSVIYKKNSTLSKPTVEEIQTEFAKWGHIGCPLTMREVEVCWRHRFELEDIYGIGCDVAAGYSIEDVLPFYFKRECESTVLINTNKES